MQNSMFLAVLTLIFALKREMAPSKRKYPPKDREMSCRSGWQLTEKLSEFRWRPFFFGDHLILDSKTLWICLNPIENKEKFGSSLFTVESNFKKSPLLCEILATRLTTSDNFRGGFRLFFLAYLCILSLFAANKWTNPETAGRTAIENVLFRRVLSYVVLFFLSQNSMNNVG